MNSNELYVLVERALRGEKTNPCPGHKYFIIATYPNGGQSPLPLPFSSPEDAALMLVQILPLLPEELTYDVAVAADAAVKQ